MNITISNREIINTQLKKEYDKEYYQKNKEKKKEREKKRYLNNKELINNRNKKYYLNNKEKVKKRDADYYLNNREKILNKKKVYRQKNNEIIRKNRLNYKNIGYFKHYYNYRYNNDILYRLEKVTKVLINSSIKKGGFNKKSKTSEILGCSFDEFKKYLESKFEPWMNWNNYGDWNGKPKDINVSWDIDHIVPISSANTEEEILKLNYYTNLQPLCSYTNRYIKRNILIEVK